MSDMILDSACVSVTQGVHECLCTCVCVRGGREGAETIPNWCKGIIQLIGFLQLQVVCYSWNVLV